MAKLRVRPARRPLEVLAPADRPLREVFEADYRRLVNASQALVDDRREAEEIVQEALARSYVAWNKTGVPPEPAAYVRAAVINLSRNSLRRRVLRRAHRREPSNQVDDPEQAAMDRAEHRRVTAAVSSLPRRQRECVALRYLLDVSVLETAEILNITEGSVKTHTHRALRKLESLLGVPNP